MGKRNYWQCESGKHSGPIEPGSFQSEALKLFRERGGKGPLIIPDTSCTDCHPIKLTSKHRTPKEPKQ
jgi:hypothetical protein